MTKWHRGSAESLDLAHPKPSKFSPGAHNRESSRDRSARVAPVVSVQPPVTISVSDQASCDEDGLCMETSDDIVTAVPRGPAVSKSAVQSDPRLPMTVALQTIPRMSGRFTKRPVPRWNAACTKAVQEKRAAFSRVRRHRGDLQCLEAFRCCRARDGWMDFV
ncbi:hypothetical protein E2C01_089784 [Portunus trituberculatus]|uniref:Uncharacterized protein n=1 Tax=Portunus trituberculatus TaxID=210409 RepID=A0A5B7JND7_PORTR|nr:hypothetical protein [Portunus trituberculatus]